MKKSHYSAIEKIASDAMKAWQVPGMALAVVTEKEIIYLGGFGVNNVQSGMPVGANTVFACASLTKSFTSSLLAFQVKNGRLKWEDSVSDYLEYFHLRTAREGRDVTIRDLVANRVGLARHDLLWYGSNLEQEEIVRRISCLKLDYELREQFSYNNILYSAAGLVLEKVCGQKWQQIIKDNIFVPLSMKNASCTVPDSTSCKDYATPYERKNTGLLQEIAWRDLTNIAPAGAVNASVSDLSSWMMAQLSSKSLMHNRSISAIEVNETHIPQVVIRLDEQRSKMYPVTNQMTYGMGWSILDYRGKHMITHDGAIDGFRSRVALLPNEGFGIAILSNLNNTMIPEALRNSICDYLLDAGDFDWNMYYQPLQTKLLKYKKPVNERLCPEIENYVGQFYNCAYGLASIIKSVDKIQLIWSSYHTDLRWVKRDSFAVAEENALEYTRIDFSKEWQGAVTAFTFLGQLFQKVAQEINIVHELDRAKREINSQQIPREELA